MKRIRFSRSARRHRIGKAHAYYVMANTPAVMVIDETTSAATLTWIGTDTRNRELEIVAVEKPDAFLVIHVMPTHLRRTP